MSLFLHDIETINDHVHPSVEKAHNHQVVWAECVEDGERKLKAILEGLSPTLYAIKIAKVCLETGDTGVFKTAAAPLNSLWDGLAAVQEKAMRMLGAGVDVSISDELLGTIADTLGELDALEHAERFHKKPLRETVEMLEAARKA